MKDASNSFSVDEWIKLQKNNQGNGAFLTLVELIEKGYTEFADKIAVSNMGADLTYRELGELATHFASYLQSHFHIKKGDRVAIMMPNCLQYCVALHAILRIGAVVVNINPMYKPRELLHQVNDAECDTIILMSMSASTLSEVLSQTKIKNVIITHLGDLLSLVKGTIINLAVKYIRRLVKPYNIPNAVYFKKALSLGKKLKYNRVDVSASDIAFLQYTGGTTGVAKGAMLAHANMCANVWQTQVWAGNQLPEFGKTALNPLPLYHIFALMINAFTIYSIGGRVILITDPRDISQYPNLFRKYPVTMLTGLNTLFLALLANKEFRQLDFSNLKFTVGGGMATRQAVSEEWEKMTKHVIIDGYGLTETSPVVSINPISIQHYTGTIGKPVAATQVEIRDDQGKSLPVGETGEICVKGPQVMLGYWRNPAETANVLGEDGWLKTGDVGKFDVENFITLVDRKKELISVSGFKVYPNEVEEVLTSHPGISEAAVIGIPDKTSGEHVKAYVVKKDPNVTAEEIMSYCHDNLTGYKRPHEIVFRESLPKSNVGKVLRRALREEEGL